MGLTPADEYGYAEPLGYPAAPRFEELLGRHRSDLHSFVARRVTDPGLVDDIVQETLLRAYRARAGFDRRRPIWPWLATIAKNTILNTLRGEQLRRRHLDRETDWRAVEGYADPLLADDPAKRYASKEQRAAIVRVLGGLDARQRKVLLMRAAEGRSYEEIARSEGLSIDAVKSLLKRTRRTFRERYDGVAPEREAPALVPLLAARRDRVRASLRRVRARAEYRLEIVAAIPGIDSAVQTVAAAAVAGTLLLTTGSGAVTDAATPESSPPPAAVHRSSHARAEVTPPAQGRRGVVLEKQVRTTTPSGEAAVALVGDVDRGRPDRRTVHIHVRYDVPATDQGIEYGADVPCSANGEQTGCDAADAVIEVTAGP